MLADLWHLSRTLRRSPGSAVAAVLTLSLTLGAAASIFAVVHAVVLTPPPFQDPDALVMVGEVPVDGAGPPRTVPWATFAAWRDRAASLAALEAFDGTNVTLTGLGPAERISVTDATPGFLSLLGVSPVLGRPFTSHDLAQPVVIVSHAFWRGKLAADPAIIGRSIALGGQPTTIIGVLPEEFRFELDPFDMLRPVPFTPGQAARAGYRVRVLARLAANVSPASLGAALDDVSRASSPPARAVATPVVTVISGHATRTLGLLAGAAALAMLIAFANFAGLLVVRSIDRRRELAVRSALGARGSQIVRQLLLEAQALVAIGTFGGVVLALWMTPAMARLALQDFGGLASRHVTVNWPVIAAIAGIAAICGGACAFAPALMASRFTVLDVLRRGATAPRHELVLRRVLAAGEVALAFVLLACVTLVGGSLLRLLAVDPGFDARGVLTMHVAVPASYTRERVASFYASLQDDLDARLGARSAAIVNEIPLDGSLARTLVGMRPADAAIDAVVREAGPAYFDVMRIPLISGRSFDAHDDASAPPRVVISSALAERLFGTGTSVGRQVWLADGARTAEVIGVVGDVAHRLLDEPRVPTVYWPARQAPSRSSIVVVRSPRPAADVAATVRDVIGSIDGDLPVYGVRTMDAVVAASPGMPARRVLTAAYAGFASLALALCAIGLFGVVAHDVANRRTELALRMAVGAGPRRIVGAILRHGAVMVGSGLVLGGVLSTWAARAIGAAGVGADRVDAASVALAAAVLIVTGGAAVLPAARRAVRTDPLVVLRGD